MYLSTVCSDLATLEKNVLVLVIKEFLVKLISKTSDAECVMSICESRTVRVESILVVGVVSNIYEAQFAWQPNILLRFSF